MTALTVRTTSAEAAEEVVIALAATTGDDVIRVLTDLRGRISKRALYILKSIPRLPEVHLVGVPEHEFLQGNEAAHAAASAHTHQAITEEGKTLLVAPQLNPLTNYGEIFAHCRLNRRKYPEPHPRLSRDEATTLRRLLTNTYPHSTLLHAPLPNSMPHHLFFSVLFPAPYVFIYLKFLTGPFTGH